MLARFIISDMLRIYFVAIVITRLFCVDCIIYFPFFISFFVCHNSIIIKPDCHLLQDFIYFFWSIFITWYILSTNCKIKCNKQVIAIYWSALKIIYNWSFCDHTNIMRKIFLKYKVFKFIIYYFTICYKFTQW